MKSSSCDFGPAADITALPAPQQTALSVAADLSQLSYCTNSAAASALCGQWPDRTLMLPPERLAFPCDTATCQASNEGEGEALILTVARDAHDSEKLYLAFQERFQVLLVYLVVQRADEVCGFYRIGFLARMRMFLCCNVAV